MASKKKILTPWLGLPVDLQLEEYEGYVYLITNILTRQRYIGRKYFWSKRKLKVKGQKRRKLIKTESDWRYYKSSSDDLKTDIEKHGLKNFIFEILSLHKTRAETNYHEIREQFVRDVLYAKLPNGEYEFYNSCIMNRYYRSKVNAR